MTIFLKMYGINVWYFQKTVVVLLHISLVLRVIICEISIMHLFL